MGKNGSNRDGQMRGKPNDKHALPAAGRVRSYMSHVGCSERGVM